MQSLRSDVLAVMLRRFAAQVPSVWMRDRTTEVHEINPQDDASGAGLSDRAPLVPHAPSSAPAPHGVALRPRRVPGSEVSGKRFVAPQRSNVVEVAALTGMAPPSSGSGIERSTAARTDGQPSARLRSCGWIAWHPRAG